MRIIPSTADAANGIAWVLRLFPSFCFADGLLNIGSREFYAFMEDKKEAYKVYDTKIALGDIIMLAVTGIIYIVLLFVYEHL